MHKASKSKFSMITIRCALIALILPLLFACAPADDGVSSAKRDIFAMDTYMSITCYGKNSDRAAEKAIDEIKRIDALLSIESPSGSVFKVNSSGSAPLDSETELIVEKAFDITKSTDGAFDITVLPIMKLWGFTDGNYRVPKEDELKNTLEHVGSGKLTLSKGTLSLNDALGIDLGGIAKGYTSDRLMQLLKECGISSACVSLGGNVQCLGTKPDGGKWRCGIVHPLKKESGEYLGVISIKDKAVITSGAYERNFTDEESGQLYHHIIDPKSGCPAASDLISVTIVSDSGILADALSTACYVMGRQGAIDYWNKSGRCFDMILMSDDGKLYITENAAADFKTELNLNIIE